MNERAIFTEALDQSTPEERAAFLERTCAGDPDLRARVESLLRTHEHAGDYLGKLAPQRLAEELAGPGSDDTRTGPAVEEAELPLDFLSPSDKPGVLGHMKHYEVRAVVGRGGMGVVLKAFDESLHRMVAVKVMAPQLAASSSARQRFVREARAAAAVTHEHVVTIHAVDEVGGLPYLVMQFVDGVSLQDRLDRSGTLPLAEILRIGAQAAAGLAAAHAQGLVHRDVKPANILLENGVERVKITDFGLARAADDASLTQSGTVAGTPSFMSPEQAEGKSVDHRSDLFSLGSVLYAMCTGCPPFRASTNMGVLKRVCEETPKPIRETNPEVPDWLIAAVERLHAKDPAGRFQSAAEVAELLGRHLAHVQHPSAVPLPTVTPPADGSSTSVRPQRGGRRAVAVVVAALVATLAFLGTTEAIGVTNVRATVIRIFTTEGTLVVETDDAGLRVTVEGDGDPLITGPGPQEVRLKAGSYRLKATKDGKAVTLDRDLVTISRGDRQIVRVRLEVKTPAVTGPKPQPSAMIPPRAEPGAFVVLGGIGVAERKFDKLAEAVAGAGAGDTIEVRGNGPFVTEPVRVVRSLTIRAGAGFRPLIRLSPEWVESNEMLGTKASLILEGLEFEAGRPTNETLGRSGILAAGPSLHVANCRFLFPGRACIGAKETRRCVVRNCDILAPIMANGFGVGVSMPFGGDGRIDNSVILAGTPVTRRYSDANLLTATLRISRTSLVSSRGGAFFFTLRNPSNELQPGQTESPVRADISSSILNAQAALFVGQENLKGSPIVDPDVQVRRAFQWRGQANLYDVFGSSFLQNQIRGSSPASLKDLAKWGEFWGTAEPDSIEGRVRYQGGDLFGRLQAAVRLTPTDFRLHPDSAGYRAGKDGKDIGPDINLVGPGKAYEAWKTTPDYQHWLKEIKEVPVEASLSEPKPFVVVSAKNKAESKFDTFATAVASAEDDDAIEIRGNGPFVTGPVKTRRRLTIRAGAGLRPLIQLSADSVKVRAHLLETSDSLTLEGLELQLLARTPDRRGDELPWQAIVLATKGRLAIANCRFLFRQSWGAAIEVHGATVEIRNSEILGTSWNLGSVGLGMHLSPDGALTVDNCCLPEVNLTCGHSGVATTDVLKEVSVRINRCTLIGECDTFAFNVFTEKGSGLWAKDRQTKLLRIVTSGNIWDANNSLLMLNQMPLGKTPPAPGQILQPGEAEGALPRLLSWQGERNLYAIKDSYLALGLGDATWRRAEPAKPIKNLADWRRYCESAETGSTEGKVRYQGGDLHSRMASAPERLVPEDFRLHTDSVGYRAGKDGKDIGADVELVGPGAAYERWKQTPDYQQWLRETGQKK